MLNNVASSLRKLTFIKRNKTINSFLKKSSLVIAKLIYGEKKLVSIASKYNFYLDSSFAFSNYESWGQEHNGGFSKLIEVSKDKKVIFDIGGHVGLCALPMSAQIDKSSKIYTFEPSNQNRKFLKKHISMNNINNIEVIEDLLGDSIKNDVEFYELIDVSGTPSIVNIKEGFKKVLKKQITLDSFCAERNVIPELLKIDVEGAEFFVIDGAYETIEKHKPDIMLSLHPKHLKQLGLDINYVFEFAEKFNYNIYDCNTMKILSNKDFLLFDEYYLTTKKDMD